MGFSNTSVFEISVVNAIAPRNAVFTLLVIARGASLDPVELATSTTVFIDTEPTTARAKVINPVLIVLR